MKINFTKELRKDSLLSNVVLHCIANVAKNDLASKLAEEGKTDEGVILDIVLTVNGREMNLESFINNWQSQVHRIIKETAEEIIEEKFCDVEELLSDLGDRVKSEIHQRLEDWEKD